MRLRHISTIIVVAVIAWSLVFYLPSTPTWSVIQLKQAIDQRDGDAAARYVDFDSVVKNAGQQMMQEKAANDPLSALVGGAAVSIFSHPLAQLLADRAKQKVENGDHDVQMPWASVVASMVMLHRNGDRAWTKFTDNKGQDWEIDLTREDSRWQVTEVKDVRQILARLEAEQQKGEVPPPSAPSTSAP
ncbi:MAG TPA: DUF2939 domain-containing protein [Candidatus Binataceae bacterium]|nr:DUF2939 domain-containing protein [Candidatus Binataceae bacterium]